jgi:hypothetical protein
LQLFTAYIADWEKQVLDNNDSLHFALLRLQLVELIRTYNSTPGGDITPALTFATTRLAPRASVNSEFLTDLELTMALLVFPPDNLEPQLAALLHPDLRRSVADRVNRAILTCQNQRRDATIRNLVRLRAWAENTARENKKDLPARIELKLEAEEQREMQGNGPEPMVTWVTYSMGDFDITLYDYEELDWVAWGSGVTWVSGKVSTLEILW